MLKTKLVLDHHVPAKKGVANKTGAVPVYRVQYFETQKNLNYIKKRKELTVRGTQELGVSCFG